MHLCGQTMRASGHLHYYYKTKIVFTFQGKSRTLKGLVRYMRILWTLAMTQVVLCIMGDMPLTKMADLQQRLLVILSLQQDNAMDSVKRIQNNLTLFMIALILVRYSLTVYLDRQSIDMSKILIQLSTSLNSTIDICVTCHACQQTVTPSYFLNKTFLSLRQIFPCDIVPQQMDQ